LPSAAHGLRTGDGRPFAGDRRRDDAILEATIELLAEVGYHGLTMEAVAARARVGKATVYRRWSSKGALVGEAMARHLSVAPVPDTGSVRGDLLAAIATTIANYTETVAGVVIPAVATDLSRDPELLAAFRAQFLNPRRAASAEVLERAIARGELPADLDIPLVMDVWAGTIFYRVLISGEPIGPGFAEQLADLVLQVGLPRRLEDPATRRDAEVAPAAASSGRRS